MQKVFALCTLSIFCTCVLAGYEMYPPKGGTGYGIRQQQPYQQQYYQQNQYQQNAYQNQYQYKGGNSKGMGYGMSYPMPFPKGGGRGYGMSRPIPYQTVYHGGGGGGGGGNSFIWIILLLSMGLFNNKGKGCGDSNCHKK